LDGEAEISCCSPALPSLKGWDRSRRLLMMKLFIAKIRSAVGTKPLVTVRAAAEGEARLFLEAAYPEEEIVDVAEPSGWASDADTGSSAGDIREHAGVEWQAPSSHAD